MNNDKYLQYQLDDPNSCIPSAVNIYFEAHLFKSAIEFDEKQKQNLKNAHINSSHKNHIYNPNMVNKVVFKSKTYQREILKPNLNLKPFHNKYYLTKILNDLENGKYIIDFERKKGKESIGHQTVILKKGKKIRCIEPGFHQDFIPYTNFPLNDKILDSDKRINLTVAYYLRSISIIKYNKLC